MAKKDNNVKRTLHYFFQEIAHYKWYALGVFILTPIVIFIRNILGAWIFADMIEKVSLGLPQDELIRQILPEAIAYIAFYMLNTVVLSEVRVYLIWKMELKAIYHLGSLAFDSICNQSMQFHSDHFSGSLVSQTNKFVSAFERFCDTIIFNLLPTVSFITFAAIIIAQHSPIFALGFVISIVVYTLICALTFKNLKNASDEEASAQNKQTGQLSDSISNITSVKSYAKESHERHRYANFQRKTLNTGLNLMRKHIGRDMLFNIVLIGFTSLILVFLINGSEWFGLSISALILIVNYSESALGNLYDITHVFKELNRVFGDANDMVTILDMEDDVVDAKNAQELVIKKGSIKFDNVSFKHKDAKESIFENFNLDIKPGERIGLVGMSGSGKTTITKLLLRFANINTGTITIDGQDVATITQKSLRENIAYVPQETALFHRSISENIAYAKNDATEADILRAAKLANATEFINDLPAGYDTLVGERGIKLSGGQRQRIAIARAILKDAPILVLDEATSALDSESEALIQGALDNLMRGRTSIVIAHRLSTIANLDRIVVLDNGKIVEQGTHEELLAKKGAYFKLWSRQSGAFLDKEAE